MNYILDIDKIYKQLKTKHDEVDDSKDKKTRNLTYPLSQFRCKVQNLRHGKYENNRIFGVKKLQYFEEEVMDQFRHTTRSSVYFGIKYLKKAIEDSVIGFGDIPSITQRANNNGNNNNNNNRSGDRSRDRSRSRDRGSIGKTIVPANIYNNLDDDIKLTYKIIKIYQQQICNVNDNKPVIIKLSDIFGSQAYLTQQYINRDVIRKTLKQKHKSIQAIGNRDKYILISPWIEFIATLDFDKDFEAKILCAIKSVCGTATTKKKQKKTKEVSPKCSSGFEMEQKQQRESSSDIEILALENKKITSKLDTSSDFEMKTSNELENEPSVKSYPYKALTQSQWQKLHGLAPEICAERLYLCQMREEYILNKMLYGATIERNKEDGDCLENSFEAHDVFIHGIMNPEIKREPKKWRPMLHQHLMDNTNRGKYESDTNRGCDRKVFLEKGKFLEEDHVVAYHNMEGINTAIFLFNETMNWCDIWTFFNNQFGNKPPLFVSHSQKTVEHYNSIIVPFHALKKIKNDIFPSENGVHYQMAEDHGPFKQLIEFDKENNVQALLHGDYEPFIHKALGKSVGIQALECYPITHLIEMISSLNIQGIDIKCKCKNINDIVDEMNKLSEQ